VEFCEIPRSVMTSSPGVEGKVHVGIFTPAFSYPASLSYTATVSAVLADLGLQEDDCEFMKQDNDKLACVIKNNSMSFCAIRVCVFLD
jgi:hypothetical protein